MAFIDVLNQLDDETVLNIIRKGIVYRPQMPTDNDVNKAIQITPAQLASISDSLTDLQNSFNAILTYTTNVGKLQQVQNKRIQSVNRENTIEATNVIDNSIPDEDGFDTSDLQNSLESLSNTIEKLSRKMKKLNLQGGGIMSTVADVAEDVIQAGLMARGLGAVGSGIGAGLGMLGKLPLRKIGIGAAALGAGALAIGGFSSTAEARPVSKPSPQGMDSVEQSMARAREKSERAARALEESKPAPTSYSARFAEFLDQTIDNMSSWASRATDYIKGAFTGGGMFDSGYYPPAGSTENAKKAFEYFKSQGWSPEQAAGIVGTMQMESGANLDPNAYNEAGGGNGAWGIAQWRADRQVGEKPMKALGVRTLRGTSFEQQLQYVQWELNNSEKGAGDALKKASTVDEAVRIFLERYERAAGHEAKYGQRLSNAYAVYNNVSSQAASGKQGRVTSSFGMRTLNGVTRMHEGIDIGAEHGSSVHAYGNGRVVRAGTMSGYGNVVDIDHQNGYVTRYAHLSSINVSVGSSVSENDVIGRVGSTGRSTGPHLHFEVIQGGEQINPANFYRGKEWIVGGKQAQQVVSQRANTGTTVSTKTKQIKNLNIAVPFKRGKVTDFIRQRSANQFEIKNSAGLDWTPITPQDVKNYGAQNNIDMVKYFDL